MDGDDDGEFTFPAPPPPPPAAVAEMPPRRQGDGGIGLLWPARLPTASSALLWPFSSPSAAATDDAAAARHEEERSERMDMLWEDFNDELLLQLRCQRRDAGEAPAASSSSPDDDDDDDGRSLSSPSPAAGRGYCYQGCAPTMLRASSRAGGVGQLYSRGSGRRSRATTGWEILLRLFRKLFAVDNSSSSPPTPCSHHHRRHGSIYVP